MSPVQEITPSSSPPTTAFRLVQWCTLAALAWKLGPFVEMWRCYYATPLRQSFFPTWLESSLVLLVVYAATLVALAVAAMTVHPKRRQFAAWTTLFMVSLLCIHQGSYNDMTFATAWWTSLWSTWLAGRLDVDPPNRLMKRAAFLSRCIVAMILLGGAVGKWTDEYWSGQVLYEIYFVDRNFWFFNLLRDSLDLLTLRDVATWYSRKVIAIETLCGLGLWALPPRWAAIVGMFVLTSIAVFSNFSLFSVLLSLIGLAAAGLFVNPPSPPDCETTSDSVASQNPS